MRKKLTLIVLGGAMFLGGFGVSIKLQTEQNYQRRNSRVTAIESNLSLNPDYEEGITNEEEYIESQKIESKDWPGRLSGGVGFVGTMFLAYGVGLHKKKKREQDSQE